MSRHWNPQEELARHHVRGRKPWPTGATAGLVLIATACVGLGLVLYKVAGPREIVAEDAGE